MQTCMKTPSPADHACLDYWRRETAALLLLHTSYGTTEEMPVDYFFRDATEFPPLEQFALSVCQGRVLEIGAGTGGHALYLQQQGLAVTTLDTSAAAVRIQQERGVQQALLADYRTYNGLVYDTVLLLMNGIGVVGTLVGLRSFLQQAQQWLVPTGQLLFDSSDIAYLYDDIPAPTEHYYGEVRYQYEYQQQRGEWFPWLYVDSETLQAVAQSLGWHAQVIFQDDTDQYVARLTRAAAPLYKTAYD